MILLKLHTYPPPDYLLEDIAPIPDPLAQDPSHFPKDYLKIQPHVISGDLHLFFLHL
jgi:hypothetical protein